MQQWFNIRKPTYLKKENRIKEKEEKKHLWMQKDYMKFNIYL